jgi:acyl-CoA reductase-like NAD-dependent aldehyde dehydrogenase
MAPRDRMAVLANFARLIEENVERFSLLDTLCMGKPINDMVTIDVPAAARNFAYFGELVDKIDGTVVTATASTRFTTSCASPWAWSAASCHGIIPC